jgi:hypothetical protein
VVDLFSILNLMMNYIFPVEETLLNKYFNENLLVFSPSLRISIENENLDLEEYIEKFLKSQKLKNSLFPVDFLVGFRWFLNEKVIKDRKCKPSMLLFVFDESCLTYYELDAFIEYRSDDINGGRYFSYVKIGGQWFQCFDSKIKQICVSSLCIALSRSFLFHYKKLNPKNNKLV